MNGYIGSGRGKGDSVGVDEGRPGWMDRKVLRHMGGEVCVEGKGKMKSNRFSK